MNSVSCTGSIVVNSTSTPSTMLTSTTKWNRAASRGGTSLPHCQPKYCATVYLADRVHLRVQRMEQGGGGGHDAQREQPAEREPDQDVGPHGGQLLRSPALLDAAGREEEHLVRRHGGGEQRDRE